MTLYDVLDLPRDPDATVIALRMEQCAPRCSVALPAAWLDTPRWRGQ